MARHNYIFNITECSWQYPGINSHNCPVQPKVGVILLKAWQCTIVDAIFGSLHAKSHFAEFGKEYAHCCPYKRLTFRSNCPSSHSSSGSQNVFAFFPHVCIKSVYPIGETNIALDIHDGKANNNKSHLYLLLDTENNINTCIQ